MATYFIGIVSEQRWTDQIRASQRLTFVKLLDEKEALTKYEGQFGPEWKQTSLENAESAESEVWSNPIDGSTKENYRALIMGLGGDAWKDLLAVEEFYRKGFRAIVHWISVTEEVFWALDGSRYQNAIMGILTHPSLDFSATTDYDRVYLQVARHEPLICLAQAPKCKAAIMKWLMDLAVPSEICEHLLPS